MARPRITADVSDEVRRGLLIAAAERDMSIGQLIEQMARSAYPEYIERAKKIIASQGEPAPARKSPRK